MNFVLYLRSRVMCPCIHKGARILFSNSRSSSPWKFSLVGGQMPVHMLHIYLLTPWSRVLLEKLTGFQPNKKFPAFPIHQCPPPVPILNHLDPVHTLTLILSSHLCLGLPTGLFPSGFPTKMLYTPLLSPILVNM